MKKLFTIEELLAINEKLEIEKVALQLDLEKETKKGQRYIKRIEREKQQTLFEDSEVVGSLPPINLLDAADNKSNTGYSEESLEHLSRLLEHKLLDFGIKADVVESFDKAIRNDFNLRPGFGSTDFWNFVESDMYMDLSGVYASSYIDECFAVLAEIEVLGV